MGRWILGVIVALVLAVPGMAQQGTFVRTERLGLPAVEEGVGAFGASTNAIIGTARGADRSPIPEAQLQLRDLRGGQVVERATADAEGRFAFRSLEPGTYIIEMTLIDGSVVALSEAVTIGSGEIIQTLVQLASRTRTFGWWLGSTTSSALASAASLGVLSVEPGAPASPVS
ncbi:MAG: carboxypeptidase-like regulatory domain-containing protein [Vicinamibacterales bacterium]|nr:carboxypeptidase-like regulatory domain-containing protein [Vicinamibacterales bacterium]